MTLRVLKAKQLALKRALSVELQQPNPDKRVVHSIRSRLKRLTDNEKEKRLSA